MTYIIDWLLHIAEVLPDDTFKTAIESLKLSNDVLGYFNYFIPVSTLLYITSGWVTLIIAYRFFILKAGTIVSFGKKIFNIDLGNILSLFK